MPCYAIPGGLSNVSFWKCIFVMGESRSLTLDINVGGNILGQPSFLQTPNSSTQGILYQAVCCGPTAVVPSFFKISTFIIHANLAFLWNASMKPSRCAKCCPAAKEVPTPPLDSTWLIIGAACYLNALCATVIVHGCGVARCCCRHLCRGPRQASRWRATRKSLRAGGSSSK